MSTKSKNILISMDQINEAINFLRKDWNNKYEKPNSIWGEKKFFTYKITKKNQNYIVNDILKKTNLNLKDIKIYSAKINSEYSAYASLWMSGDLEKVEKAKSQMTIAEANIMFATKQLLKQIIEDSKNLKI